MRHLPLRLVTAALAATAVTAVPASAHVFDHPVPPTFAPGAPLASGLNSGGVEGTEWSLVESILTGNPHTDLDFFTQGDNLYAAVGTLAIGANGGGQTIVQLMQDGTVDPAFVSAHPSAACGSLATGITGLQHDVEATPKGDVLFNTDMSTADRRDAQLLLDATDASGRCHDNGDLAAPGTDVPNGGLEIVDVRDVTAPFELALTTHVGEAHTVNVDPKRPHIAFVSSSDGGSVDDDGNPAGASTTSLHTVEIVDLSSCLDLDPASSQQERRDACRPVVYRMPWEPSWTRSVYDPSTFGACHETEIYPDDTLACAGLDGTVLLDLSGAFDDQGTPDDYTDDTVRGTPLPCRERESTSAASPTEAVVIDCVHGDGDVALSIDGWREIGAPSVEGVELIGFVNHGGVAAGSSEIDTGPRADIQISHEAELSHSGDFLIVSDERGGGLLPGDATCDPAELNAASGNGGLHAFRVDGLFTELPDAEGDDLARTIRDRAYARTPDGDAAIWVATPRVPAPTFCTAHVFHQIPDQNRIFMGWYSQGTQVVDYVEHPDGSFEFVPVAYFVPENANTWTSAVFHYEDNGDGTYTYYGATGDFMLAGYGRNAIDVYSVTLPAPAQTAVDAGEPTPEPVLDDTSEPSTPDDEAPQAAPGGGDLPATGGGPGLVSVLLTTFGAVTLARTRRRRANAAS